MNITEEHSEDICSSLYIDFSVCLYIEFIHTIQGKEKNIWQSEKIVEWRADKRLPVSIEVNEKGR